MSYSVPRGRFPRVTHPSATISEEIVRLACVKHAASVRSEPGSNSQVHLGTQPDKSPAGHLNKSHPSHIELTSPITRPKAYNQQRHLPGYDRQLNRTGRRPRIPSQIIHLSMSACLGFPPGFRRRRRAVPLAPHRGEAGVIGGWFRPVKRFIADFFRSFRCARKTRLIEQHQSRAAAALASKRRRRESIGDAAASPLTHRSTYLEEALVS